MIITVADDPAQLAQALASRLIARAQAAACHGQRLRVALAGGRTPAPLYTALAERHDELPWDALEIYFGDERGVPWDHADSNYGMARRLWLHQAPAGHVYPMRTDAGVTTGAADYAALLATRPPLDVVLLGMGDDGHTASLFADQALDPHARTLAVPATPHRVARISLGLRTLVAAGERWVLIHGPEKVGTLREILTGQAMMPLAVLGRQAPLDFWLDRRAAAALCPGP
ncbi:MAG: 6-phosphogluconolactonase [Acidiferrobacter sp.]